MVEEVRGVDEALALGMDPRFDHGVRVAERGDADAAQEIEEVVAVCVAKIDAFSADEEVGVSLIGVEEQFALCCLIDARFMRP